MTDTLAYVLAGGDSKRFKPLPQKTVTFLGPHRVIDFALSNLENSGVNNVFVLAQGSHTASLEEHVAHVWPTTGTASVTVVRPNGSGPWAGTASAVAQNLGYLKASNPDVVNILPADHVYSMDFRQMNQLHLETGADLTISAVPVPWELARGNYGVPVLDKAGRLISWQEKPLVHPEQLEGNQPCLASMGIYAFKPGTLCDVLGANDLKDFGHNVISFMLNAGMQVRVYDFSTNTVPGTVEQYWRDIGNVPEFHRANMEAAGSQKIKLNNPEWRIRSNGVGYPDTAYGRNVNLSDVVVSRGDSFGDGSEARSSVFTYNVKVGSGARVNSSACLGDNRIGDNSVVANAILLPGANVPAGARVGVDREEDAARGFPVFGGVTVVQREYAFA